MFYLDMLKINEGDVSLTQYLSHTFEVHSFEVSGDIFTIFWLFSVRLDPHENCVFL